MPDPTVDPTSVRAALSDTRTFAAEAGIRLRDAPAPLLQLVVLATLLASPVRHDVAIRAARALRPQTRSAAALAGSDPADLSRLLTGAGYWRFHHTKADLLARTGTDVAKRLGGDLRRLYREAGSSSDLHRALRAIPGVGTQAAHIVLREAQGVWPDLQPYLDDRVLDGAARLGLPTDVDGLAALVDPDELPRLASACVRATLSAGRRRTGTEGPAAVPGGATGTVVIPGAADPDT